MTAKDLIDEDRIVRLLTKAGRFSPEILFLLGFWRMFRPIVAEGFRSSIGDGGDGLILIATLEHWNNLAAGHAIGPDWRDDGFFYPTHDTLGFTDCYFLYAPSYCVLRMMGIGPFAAYSATIALFSMIGFWSMVAICRQGLGAPRIMAGICAFIIQSAPAGVDRLLRTIHAIGAGGPVPTCQS